MKKIFFASCAAVALMSMVACSDSAFEDRYADPAKTTTVGVPQVFTAVLQKGNTWMNPVYYRYYTQSTTSGRFSGVIGDANTKGRYQGATEAYFNTRWTNFYDMLTQYRVLEKTYNDLDDSQKEVNKVFYFISRSVLQGQLHEMLSLFGDVPYSQAGTLWSTGDFAAAKPAYDDDVTAYKQILADLKEAGDFLGGSVSSTGLASLGRQDYTLAAGSQAKWQKYVNSLRLRIALHLATAGDCQSEAKAAIAEILNNPSKYPVIESNDDNQGVACDTSNDTFNYGKSISQALNGRFEASCSPAMLAAMNVPANGLPTADTDPRLAAMYDPNPEGAYLSYDLSLTNSQIDQISSEKNKEYVQKGMQANYYAVIDSVAVAGWAQYQGNGHIDGIWMSAAEVALSKAEAYVMGYGVSKDEVKAKAAFVDGVALSNEYYWNLKTNSTIGKAGNDSYQGYRELVVATEADARAYAEKIWDGSQKCVATQLWINHGFMNELEAWNVVRRTGYPVVKFTTDTQMTGYPTPPHRLPYPSDELTYNGDKCQEAIAKNYSESTGYYTPLFWAKKDYYTLLK